MAFRGRAAADERAPARTGPRRSWWRHLAVATATAMFTATIGVATAPPAAAAGDDEIAAANDLADLVENTLGGLAGFGPLGEAIPGTDLVPTGPAGLDLLDTLSGIAAGIRALPDKTESAVEDNLNGLTTIGSVQVDVQGADVDTSAGTLTIDTFELSRTVDAPLAFSTGEPGSADFFSLAGGSLSGDVVLDLTSGGVPLVFDLVPSGEPGEGSIVGLADPVPDAVLSADLDLTGSFDSRLGILDVTASPGDSGTAALASIEVTVQWQDPDGSGTITGDELVNVAPTELFLADVTGGAAALDVVLSAGLDGLGGETGTVTLDDPDLTDGFQDDSLDFSLGELGNFTNFTPQDVLAAVAQLAIGLRGLQLKLGNLNLPLVDENLAELANWSDRISRLFTENELSDPANPVDLDITDEQLATADLTGGNLLTIEGIIAELESALEVDPGALGLRYLPGDDVVTFTIDVEGDTFFHDTPEASVNVADELAHAGITGLDLTGDASLTVEPSYSLALTVGLDLSDAAAAVDEDGSTSPITDRIFIELGDGDELSLDVPISGDLAMVGTIGFLQIELTDDAEGPVELLAPVDDSAPMLAVDLGGPAGDRLTLTQLFDAMSSVEVLTDEDDGSLAPGEFRLDLGDGVTVTATANVGVPEFSLDAETSLEGVPAAAAGVSFAWPDLFVGEPVVGTSESFNDDFLSFNLDSEDPLALFAAILDGVEGVFGAIDGLDQSVLSDELPLTSTSLEDTLAFLGDVRAALNAMASDPSASLQHLELQASAVIATALDALDPDTDVFDVPDVPDPNDFVSGSGDDEEFDRAAYSAAVNAYLNELQDFVAGGADFLDIRYETGNSPGSVVLDFDIGVCSDQSTYSGCQFEWPITKPFNLDLGDFGGSLVGGETNGEIGVDYGVNVSADFGIDLPTVAPGGDGVPEGEDEPDVELFVLDTTALTGEIAGFTEGQASASIGPFEVQVGDASEPGIPEDADAGECDNATDDDGDGVVNDGCPTVGDEPETGDECLDDEDAKEDEDEGDPDDPDDDVPADGAVNDGCPAVNDPFDARAGVSISLTNDLGDPAVGDRSDVAGFFSGLSAATDPAAGGDCGDVLACAELPIYLADDGDPTHLGTIEFEQTDFGSDPTLDGADEVFANLKDAAPAFLWSLLGEGIREFGALVERSVDASEYGAEIPMVGDLLDAGAEVGTAFRANVTDPVGDLVSSLDSAGDFATVESEIRDHFWDTLGPDGAGLLLHHDDVVDGESATTPVKDEDIVVTLLCGDDAHECVAPDEAPEGEDGDDFSDLADVQVEFKIGQVATGASPAFDFGVPGLRLSGGEATVSSSVSWQLNVGFGLSLDDGFYVLTDTSVDDADGSDGSTDGHELTLSAIVDLGEPAGTGGIEGAPDESLAPALSGDLAFLGVEVHNAKADREDGADGDGRAAHEVTIDLSVDIPDPGADDVRLGLSELVTGFDPTDFAVTLDAGVDVYLTLVTAANFGDTSAEGAIPSLLADLSLQWDIDGTLTDGLEYGELDADFRNVRLDLGSFLGEFLGPVLAEVQRYTEPLQPIIDTLQAPIPGVAELAELVGAEPITLLGLMEQLADADLTLIRRLLDAVSLANSIPAPGSEIIVAIGEFGLESETLGKPELPANKKAQLIDSATQSLEAAVDGDGGVFGSDEFGGLDGDFGAKFDEATGDDGGFTFPAFEQPAQLFQLLVGENPTLVRFDAGVLRAEVSHSVTFGPIALGPVPVSVVVSIGAAVEGRFAMGYDTKGIRQMVQNLTDDDTGNDGLFENVGVLFAGVFIDDLDAQGNDVPEIRLVLEAAVGAAVDLVIVTAGVEAGVRATLDLNLHDGGFAEPVPPENLDGKLRVDEIVQVLQANPICLFDVSGRLEAFIRLFVKIDLGLFSKTFKQTIVNIVLLELEDITADLCDPPPPVLGEKIGSTLLLNMGERAGLRNYDEDNPDEEFTVRQLTEGSSGATISVTAYGIVQRFEGVDEVVASGSGGDDKVTTEHGAVSGVCQKDGTVEPDIGLGCEGLPDDDSDDADPGETVTKLIPFSVPVDFCGGPGADTLGGGRGDDVLRGDGRLDGTGCVDHDSGDDEDTGDGADKINGGAGDDSISGGHGADDLNGDAGDDTVHGGPAGDQITGGPGQDELHGQGGPDIILGGPEADPCPPGADGVDDPDRDRCSDAADDEIFGGPGDDSIEGDHGKDTIHAEGGDDTVVGGHGDDHVTGGPGHDTLFGNEGHDEVHGDAGDDDVHGDVGDDVLSGGADEDDIVGGPGTDTIDGGSGHDVILGDRGTINRGPDPDPSGDGFVPADPDLPLVDLVDADLSPTEVEASDFADTISGGADPDRIWGQEGGDVINGNGGHDVIRGNDGDDVISGDEDGDELYGDAGDDTIHGDDPTGSHGAADGVDIVRGGPGGDLIEGNAAGDRLFGDGGRDTIFGDAEDEAPCGIDGEDVIRGGPDDDYLFGNAEGDQIFGNGGRDRIVGGSDSFGVCDGVDTIVGGMAADVIAGDNATIDDASATDDMIVRTWLDDQGDGDVIHGDGGDASGADDRIFGQYGDDQLFGDGGKDYIEGNEGIDTIAGGAGDDDLIGGSSASDDVGGGDSVAVVDADRAGTGRDDAKDLIDGGPGEDWIAGDNALVNRNVDDGRADFELFDVGLASTDPPPPSTFGDDEILGGGDDDRIFGQGGDDDLRGQGGDDYVEGNAGDDTIRGGAGDDDLIGGGSADDGVIVPDRVGDGLRDTGETLIDGGAGEDWIAGDNALISRNVAGHPEVAFVLFDVFTTGERAELTDAEVVASLATHGGETLITGGDGADWIFGQGGDDTVQGDAGTDYVEGNEGADTILGGDGADDLVGGSSADDGVIDGDRTGDDLRDEGDDVSGGPGQDWIAGDNALVNRNRPAAEGRAPIELFDVERVDGPDVADATSGGDFLRGDAGDDRIFGQGNGAQDLDAELDPADGRNNDFLSSEGDFHHADFDRRTGDVDEDAADWSGDVIWGGTGDDEIEGNHGNDLIFGNAPVGDAESPAPNDDEDDIVGGGSADDGKIFDDARLNVGEALLDGHDVIHGDEGDATVGDDDVVLGDNGWIDRTGATVSGPGPETHTEGPDAGEAIEVSLPVRTTETGHAPDAGTFGNDHIAGNGGHDDLIGQAGDDALDGEWGSDGIVGDLGAIAVDLLGEDGGSCGDPRTVEPREPFITEEVCQPGTLFRRVQLFRFDDSQSGVVEGDDVILGGDGDDWLHGGPGVDLINGDGDGGEEIHDPDTGIQTITDPNAGSADFDRIFGGDSNGAGTGDPDALGDGDSLWGGRGHDHLFGGHGADNHDVRPAPGDPDELFPETWWAWALADVESYHGVDHIYGGHGPDAMQADVADNGPVHGDRLMDWAGTFNLSLLCPATYGAYVTVRDMSPDLIRYWEEVADTDGLHQVTDQGSSGYRELAMVYKPDVKDNNNPPYPGTPGHFYACGD